MNYSIKAKFVIYNGNMNGDAGEYVYKIDYTR